MGDLGGIRIDPLVDGYWRRFAMQTGAQTRRAENRRVVGSTTSMVDSFLQAADLADLRRHSACLLARVSCAAL